MANMILCGAMAAKTCRVSCQDLTGVHHSVEVTAESLYEAIARGLCALHANPWVGEIGEGLTSITVELQEKATVTHSILMKDFRRWLEVRGTTPAQITARERVREILGGLPEPTDRQKRRHQQEERNR
jgi:hypothetical protein